MVPVCSPRLHRNTPPSKLGDRYPYCIVYSMHHTPREDTPRWVGGYLGVFTEWSDKTLLGDLELVSNEAVLSIKGKGTWYPQ